MFCNNCGEQLEEGTVFCTNCGKKLTEKVPVAVTAESAPAPVKTAPAAAAAAPVRTAPAAAPAAPVRQAPVQQPKAAPAPAFTGRFGYTGDRKFAPLGAWNYFWLNVLYCVPLVGFVFLIVHCFTTGNYNRRSYARSHFCNLILVAVIVIALVIFMAAMGISLSDFSEMFG